jgi:hypothetical protein
MSNILRIISIIPFNIVGAREMLFEENKNQKYRNNPMLISAVNSCFLRGDLERKRMFSCDKIFLL